MESIYKAEEVEERDSPFRVAPPPSPRDPKAAATAALERSSFERVARQARTLAERVKEERTRVVGAARDEAERLLAGARMEAGAIVEEGRRALAALEAEAREKGGRAGFDAGLARGLDASRAAVDRLEAAVAEARRTRGLILETARDGIVDVAIEAARRILGRAAAADRGLVVSLVEAALERVRNAERVTVRLNLGDLGAAEAIRTKVTERLRSAASVEIREDPSVDPGGAIIETEFGRVDARLRAQLDEVERALRAVDLAQPPPPASAPEVGPAAAGAA